MKRLLMLASTAVMMLYLTGTASASTAACGSLQVSTNQCDNLLTNGDFEDDVEIVSSNFSPATGPFNIWLGEGVLATGGFAEIVAIADPADFPSSARLMQGVDLSPGEIPPGTPMQFSFDFLIFNVQGIPDIGQTSAYVIGLDDSDSPISVTAPTPLPGDILFALTSQDFPSIRNQFASAGTAHFSINQEYDALAVVFDAENLGIGIGDLGGIDNVVLSKAPVQAPEPGSLLLLGSAISAIVIARRKIQS